MLALSKAAHGLHGEITVPGDKSISHRAVMFASLAKGDSQITHFLDSDDCLATIDCFSRLGIYVERCWDVPGKLIVHGTGLHGLYPSYNRIALYTKNSGTTTRILAGILAPQPFHSLISGDDSVNTRPMRRVIEPLNAMGAQVQSLNGDGCAPLSIIGSPLHGITWHTEVASAQVKSAILCAGLYADAPTTVIEPSVSRDHTERMLRMFGAAVSEQSHAHADGTGHTVTIQPADELSPVELAVPGDISSAAYFLAAALIVPGSEVILRNVGLNPTRDGILRVARAMGGDITILNPPAADTDSSQPAASEPAADLLVRASSLHGIEIGGDIIPALIDELPVIAVMAACAEGTTVIRDAAELKVKESDRIRTMTEGLSAMGADVTPTQDGMIIHGGNPLHGAMIRTARDHRVAMSFAIAALMADDSTQNTVLDDESCVSISYPAFFDDLASLG